MRLGDPLQRGSLRRSRFGSIVKGLALGITVPLALSILASNEAGSSPSGLRRSGAADTLRVDIPTKHSREPHSISLDEIVSLREISEVAHSPDGRAAALLIRQAFRDCNCYRTALYVIEAPGQTTPAKLLEEAAISNLRWTPDGASLSYLAVRNGVQEVWKMDRQGNATSKVVAATAVRTSAIESTDTTSAAQPRASVSHFEWSPDGTRLAYVITRQPSSAELEAIARRGVIYDDNRMSLLTLLHEEWVVPRAELWVRHVGNGKEVKIWTAPEISTLPWSVGVSSFAWAPNGQSLAVSYQAPGLDKWPVFINFDIGLVSLPDNRFTALAASLEASELNPSWSPDGEHLAFSAQADAPRSALGIIDVGTRAIRYFGTGAIGRSVRRLWWSADSVELVIEAESPAAGSVRVPGGLMAIPVGEGRARRLTSPRYDMSHCGAIVGDRVVCVVQASSVPPDLAVIDIERGTLRAVTQINPELRDVQLAPVSEFRWSTPEGPQVNGFLLKPLGYTPEKRYPLLIILYGFTGRFISQAEWIPNYPAQALAAEGFAVLLANFPWWGRWEEKSFRDGAQDGYGTLASLETAVTQLASSGLVDTSKVGIMGLSRGAFYAHFAIAHSSLFKVASIANGGDYNPGTYWSVGFRAQREYYEHFLGGPPYGSSLANWLEYSPAYNAHKVKAPVLLEFDLDEAVAGLEIATGLRRHAVPVEFVVYPRGGHVLTPPDHRFYSMERNLAWFRFWLQGGEHSRCDRGDRCRHWQHMLNSRARERYLRPARCSSEPDHRSC